jgi:hypothetical protein
MNIGFEVLKVVAMKDRIFGVATPCSLEKPGSVFRLFCCFFTYSYALRLEAIYSSKSSSPLRTT